MNARPRPGALSPGREIFFCGISERGRKNEKRGVRLASHPNFCLNTEARPGGLRAGAAPRSATAAGAAAGVAFEAGSVAYEGEVAAFAAAVTLVAFHTGGPDLLDPAVGRVQRRACPKFRRQ